MARKKRTLAPVAAPEAEATSKSRYEDQFQHDVGRKIEEAGKMLEGQGRNILYGIGALIVLGIIIWIFMAWSARSNQTAQNALGKAITLSQSQVTDTPAPAGSTIKTFKTEKERAEASVKEFQAVADNFGGAVGEKAKYFVAVNQLSLDRPAAVQTLEGMAKSNDEIGKLARFTVANAKADDGKLDEAAAIYKELAAMSDPIYSKDTINFELAKIYEKQDKKQEAVDVLFTMVKAASEAKDADGKAVTMTSTVLAAKDKLQQLDPVKAKEIPEPAFDPSTANPFGM